MNDVNNVFITKEVADYLNCNPSYLIRVAKRLKNDGIITDFDMRSAGNRNYIFNTKSVNELKKKIKK